MHHNNIFLAPKKSEPPHIIMQSQSKFPYLILYVLLLYSMKIFEINTALLLESASGESAEFLFAEEGYSAGLVNRVMIPLLFAICGWLFLTDSAARRLAIKKPMPLLGIAALGLLMIGGIAISEHTNVTIARVASQLMYLAAVIALTYTLRDNQRLYLTVGLAFLTVLCIDLSLYFGLGTGFTEEGLFMGYHRNKNMSGNQYGVATMVFIFLAVLRKNPLFLLACAASATLLLFSESKTSMGSIGIFLVLSLAYRVPLARAIVIISTLIGTVAISVYFSLGENNPEIFTNRGLVWNFLSTYVWSKPLLGYGFSSFWDVGPQSLNITEGVGFVQVINTGHNGFIDIILGTGLVGLTLIVGFLFFSAVMLSRLDARYFFIHYLFIAFLISNVTESYLFYYQNIMWTMLVLMIGAAYVESRSGRRRRVQSSKSRA